MFMCHHTDCTLTCIEFVVLSGDFEAELRTNIRQYAALSAPSSAASTACTSIPSLVASTVISLIMSSAVCTACDFVSAQITFIVDGA